MLTVDGPVVGRRRRVTTARLIGSCAVLAVGSLIVPASIGYDPWAWLVWGRQVTDLDLATTGGPSWKPFPVLITSVVSLAGDAAPTLWLVVSRTAALLTLVFAYRLAARFAGRPAGAVAAGLVLLTPDGGPRYLRLLVEGHGAPMAAAMTLWAVERHLDGRRDHALLLAAGVALVRPEAWPFLGVYAWWLWHEQPSRRRLIVLALSAVPLLWFGGDWWGSGDPWHGADTAQVAFRDETDRVLLAFERAGKSVVAPAWVAALVATVLASRRGQWPLVVLGAGAFAWCALVIGMTAVLRYAALSRFFLPAAVLLCVLAGVGVVRLVEAVPARARLATVAAIAVLGTPWLVQRGSELGGLVDEMRERARVEEALDGVIDAAGGPEAVTGCGAVSYDGNDGQRPALAWKLGLPLDAIERAVPRGPAVVVARSGSRRDELIAARPAVEVDELARNEHWVATAVRCPATPPDS